MEYIIPFNSRPHKEVDHVLGHMMFYRILSIHDLTRRSTTFCRSLCRRSVFQFTTSQGGRHRSIKKLMSDVPFNSRPHKEVDRKGWEIINEYKDFQFTTSQGGRHKHRRRKRSMAYFQFTTSQGGRLPTFVLFVFPVIFQFTTSQGGRPENAD